MVHSDSYMKESHMNPHNALGIAAKVVCFKDYFEIEFILKILVFWNIRFVEPFIVARTRDSSEITQ